MESSTLIFKKGSSDVQSVTNLFSSLSLDSSSSTNDHHQHQHLQQNKKEKKKSSPPQKQIHYDEIIKNFNYKIQQNELFTLKQLYKKNFKLLHNNSYKITIVPNLPNQPIFLKTMESGQSFTPVFISKLPPIHLTFKFNENYPLISSPDWKVSCEWLNSEAVSLLSFELQQLIKKNPSLPIISIWVNWLKNQSIYLFNIISCSSKNNNNNFSLSSLTTLEPNRDQKKVQDNYHFSIPQLYKKENFDVIKYIVQYDRLNIDDDFKTCSLCNTSQTFINFVQFFNCNHSYCKECTSAYITLNIETNCLENLVCPHDDCQVLISPFEIKELVPVDTFDFYLESLSNHSCQHCNYHHLSNNIDNINKASLLS